MRIWRLVPACMTLLFSQPASAVIPISADPVIQPAHYFDLEGAALNFRPERRGYSVSTSRAKPVGAAPGELLGKADYQFIRSWGYRRALPFPFPFGGKIWREVFINGAGNLSCDRAAAGQKLIICAQWELKAPQEEKTQMYFRQSAKEFVVMWKTERYQWFGEGYRPLGGNIFQARLSADGAIELSYQKVSEKDGIVGVFPGGFTASQSPRSTADSSRRL